MLTSKMGTTTFYLKHNDLGPSFGDLTKEDLKKLDKISPYGTNNDYMGWKAAMELHNGNVHFLVWWKGRLMRLEDAPKILNRKYYDTYWGKVRNVYEWTLLKRVVINDIEWLDREFRKSVRRERSGRGCAGSNRARIKGVISKGVTNCTAK